MSIKGILTTALFIASTNGLAEPFQSLEVLREKVEAYTLNQAAPIANGRMTVQAEQLDPRLTLNECADDKILIFNPYNTPILQSTTLGIKCNQEGNHWTLYVPVKISVLKQVYVAKKPLMKGSRISEDDIYLTEMDVQRLKQGYFSDQSHLIGHVCKQNVSADTPFTPFNLELPKLVRKGDELSITAVRDGLQITMSGIAMSDGILDETIKVKNRSSKKIIEATVSGERQVQIIL